VQPAQEPSNCRRIHGSVEDTKLSTNKQHSLSPPGVGTLLRQPVKQLPRNVAEPMSVISAVPTISVAGGEMCCLLVLDLLTSTPQWIRQPTHVELFATCCSASRPWPPNSPSEERAAIGAVISNRRFVDRGATWGPRNRPAPW